MPGIRFINGPFAAVALGLVLTPGPNMMYLTSRSICQGKRAGFTLP